MYITPSNIDRFVISDTNSIIISNITQKQFNSIITQLNSIKKLTIDKNRYIEDFSMISNLKNLNHLSLKNCSSFDLSVIKDISNLTLFELYNIDNIDNVEILSNLTSLEYLYIILKDSERYILPDLSNLTNIKRSVINIRKFSSYSNDIDILNKFISKYDDIIDIYIEKLSLTIDNIKRDIRNSNNSSYIYRRIKELNRVVGFSIEHGIDNIKEIF